MSEQAKKSAATRRKNLKKKAESENKLRLANARASAARNKLKYFKEGFEEGLKVRRE
ncbi:unnamed protein product [marine sediment metagenome]|uniref:Uncharacterized protein n=1 Tax=marine sediment metagenome TaxID=412755 RepID=X1CA01_9ZZZZ